MRRRDFLVAGAGAMLIPYVGVTVADEQYVTYNREAYEKALASGAPFLLDFYAPSPRRKLAP